MSFVKFRHDPSARPGLKDTAGKFICAWLGLCVGAMALLLWAGPAAAQEPCAKIYRLGLLEASKIPIHDKIRDAYDLSLKQMGLESCIEMVPGATYTFPDGATPLDLQEAAEDLMTLHDLDLIIAVGNKAAQALLQNNNEATPVLVVALDRTAGSYLLGQERLTPANNFAVLIHPQLWMNMFRFFQASMPFSTMGVLVPEHPTGHALIHLEQLRFMTREQGLKLMVGHYKKNAQPGDCLIAIKKLVAQGIDAFYLDNGPCFDCNKGDLGQILDYLTANKVATFASGSMEQVRCGAMAGFSMMDHISMGRALAKMTELLLHGQTPNQICNVNFLKPKQTFNLETAAALKAPTPLYILIASDVIFSKIDRPKPAPQSQGSQDK